MKNEFALATAVALWAIAPDRVVAEDRVGGARGTIGIESEMNGKPTPDLFHSQAVSEATLQAIAGREDVTQVSQAELVAGVSKNSVGDNSVTGTAQIDGNAFQNMSGLSILNVNTGNNVAINAAMNVNISISPVP